MIYLLGIIYLVSVGGALMIWAKEFDEIPLTPFLIACMTGPLALISWGFLARKPNEIIIWKRKSTSCYLRKQEMMK